MSLVSIPECWKRAQETLTLTLPAGFKRDPNIMVPKPNKESYNNTKAYRPITLESIIGKQMERIVKNRLIWKLRVAKGIL